MMRAPPFRQRGIALVLVIWVAVLVLVVASSFILERRSETLVVRNSASMARGEAIADAGVNRAVFEIYRIGPSAEQWKPDGTAYDWSFDGAAVKVEIRDESAKIDINTAPDLLLRGLFVSAGVADDEAVKLVDAILDWRDADSLKRPNGAEEPEYRAAGLSYRPANAPFQAIEELQLVLGMRPEIYRRIAPSITVFSRQAGINSPFARREVLLAIPGVTTEVVDDYVARREAARTQGQPLPTLPQAAAYGAGRSGVVSVRSGARRERTRRWGLHPPTTYSAARLCARSSSGLVKRAAARGSRSRRAKRWCAARPCRRPPRRISGRCWDSRWTA